MILLSNLVREWLVVSNDGLAELQKKALSQPGTPGSTSPLRHTDSLLAPRSSLSRTPCTHKDSEQIQPPSRMSVGGRPSRRASEGVISYKEPSLISKMRRPH